MAEEKETSFQFWNCLLPTAVYIFLNNILYLLRLITSTINIHFIKFKLGERRVEYDYLRCAITVGLV